MNHNEANNYKPPTEKQRAARTRNWHVKQLRAYYHLCPPPVTSWTRLKIQRLIDEELKRLGAESETKRSEQKMRELIEAENREEV